MADETRTSRDVIRAAIEGYLGRDWLGEQPTVDEFAERIDRALFGDGTHEQSAVHWRANAAEEKRKKQHVSELLSTALRERDEARTTLAELEAEVRRALRFSRPRGAHVGVVYVVQRGGLKTFELPRIAAVLREPAEERSGG